MVVLRVLLDGFVVWVVSFVVRLRRFRVLNVFC